jgi:NADH:ubiquinone oxidoreductase subunit
MASIGTRLFTWLRGRLIGTDEFGNRYYESRRLASHGRPMRWVIYRRADEASSVPPGWHAWLHHSRAEPPSEKPLEAQRWEKPHLPNLTGTAAAYRPPGHELRGGRRAPATGDYEPWRPE